MCLLEHTTTGIVAVPVFHILAISISKSLYLASFSTTLTDIFLYGRSEISVVVIIVVVVVVLIIIIIAIG